MPQKIEFGLPLAAVVFAAIAVLTLIVGAFSPAVGFAFFVLGLLAAVLIDFSALRHDSLAGVGGTSEATHQQHAGPADQQPSGQSS